MPAHVQSSTASSTCGSRRDESLHVSSHALRLFGHELHRQVSRRLGGLAEQLFRSEERARALQPLSRRARARGRARLRRHFGQRAPPDAYGLMPSPVVMAAALARRTKNAKIAILGNAFCLREHPLTLAEEHAMLDCITG